ncbi:MAG: hypothetical protein RBT66_01170 [bacterium]|jgi:hypothetical protein|nr:hypothetical protein [bacterium]
MNFEEKIIERLKRLEREVERLRVKESPGAWQDWTPTIIYTGGTTDYSITAYRSRYVKIGKTVTVAVNLTVTVGTGNRTAIYFNLPIAPRYLEAGHAVENCTNSSTYAIRACRINAGTGRIEIHLPGKFNNDGILLVKATYEIL